MDEIPSGARRFRARIKPDDVVDMHVHLIAMDAQRGNFVSPKLRRGVTFQFLSRALGVKPGDDASLDRQYRDQIARWSDEEGAPNKIGLLGLDWVYDAQGQRDEGRSHLVVSNDAVFDLCERHERFLPVPSVNPARADALDALEEVAERGAVMIKLLPNLQGFDPEEARFRPFWRRMAELGLPLLSHTGYEHALPSLNDDWGDPLRLVGALEEGCVVVAAHCGAAGRFHRIEYFNHFVSLLARYPRLYGDVSGFASPIRAGYLGPMMAGTLRRGRVIVGSDFPIPCAVEPYARELGLAKTWALRMDKNPLRRNRRLFEALGLGPEIMTRAAKLLRGELGT